MLPLFPTLWAVVYKFFSHFKFRVRAQQRIFHIIRLQAAIHVRISLRGTDSRYDGDGFRVQVGINRLFAGISPQREHESCADRTRLFYKRQDRNAARTRARAPISLHSQWIHKYKLLNFVTRFKFAPTGEETWSWIHCLIRRTSRRCTKYITVYTRAYTQNGDASHNLIVLNYLFCSIDDSSAPRWYALDDSYIRHRRDLIC